MIAAVAPRALVVTAGEERHVAAPAVTVVDAIGAGDAFGGGFLGWRRMRGLGAEGLRDVEAVTAGTAFACEVAARTCTRAAAAPQRLAELRT